jgi:WxL Interacting Protein, peptidoglycan binding domain
MPTPKRAPTTTLRRLGVLLAGAGLALALAPSIPASAADNGSWAIVPATSSQNTTSNRAFFAIETAAGQVVRDAVAITNVTADPLTLQLYPADAFNSPGAGFALRPQNEANTDVGSWITLRSDEVTIKPKATIKVPFTMDVPPGATPGDHVGGIVALNPVATGEQTTAEGAVIQVQQAVGVRIYTRISGPLNPQLVVESVSVDLDSGGIPGLAFPREATITYTVRNEGNVRVTPNRSLIVNGLFGRTLYQPDDKPLPEILPGNEATFSEVWADPPFMDRVSATVTVSGTETSAPSSGDAVIWILPWLLLVIVLVAVGAWLFTRRRRETQEPDVEDLTASRGGAHAAAR